MTYNATNNTIIPTDNNYLSSEQLLEEITLLKARAENTDKAIIILLELIRTTTSAEYSPRLEEILSEYIEAQQALGFEFNSTEFQTEK